MPPCPFCGHPPKEASTQCPECGAYYSKVLQLIAEEEAYELEHSWLGLYLRIFKTENSKQALLSELKRVLAGLDKKARFTLFVIFVFVFALMVTVL